MKPHSLDIDNATNIAINLAKEAGQIINSHLKLGITHEWKNDHTPVTTVDKQINQIVIDTIHREFPLHNILAEEESDLSNSSEYVWVCDPLDGTFPFIHGIPVSTFTLALTKNGIPILGIIYDPFTDRLFSAITGKGAHINGLPIHTSSVKSLSDASVGVVFWQGNMNTFASLLPKLVERGSKIFNLVSIAYMDALVASGDFAATIFPGLSAHDSAAAKIIVEEAGGIFTSLTGEIDRYDAPVHGHIATANSFIHEQIQTLLG